MVRQLAEMMTTIIEGGFIMAKAMHDETSLFAIGILA